jgi:hypothetical protein
VLPPKARGGLENGYKLMYDGASLLTRKKGFNEKIL